MENIIKVGMADLQVARYPLGLTTLGLGSCVGIALFDRTTNIIGMAHAMLPDSTQSKNNSNHAKFVDTSIDLLVEKMIIMGAKRNKILAKLAGGAQMFAFNEGSDIMRIGYRNVIASKEKLGELKIPIIAEDTGGNYGRTIELEAKEGSLMIRTIGFGVKYI